MKKITTGNVGTRGEIPSFPLFPVSPWFIVLGVLNNVARGDCIDQIMSRNSQNSIAVCHYDMLLLTSDPETNLLQSANRIEMIYAG